VKLKTLAAITLVLLGCSFASAQTFNFWNTAGTSEYCNYLVITYNYGGVVAGYDDVVACGFPNNAPVVGYDGTLPGYGKGIIVGDGIYDAEEDGYTGLQWTIWVSDKSSKRAKTGHFTGKYGWLGVAGSYTGAYFGDNYGYMTIGAPEKGEVADHGTTAGKPPAKLRK
jgi:hypothetical protein